MTRCATTALKLSSKIPCGWQFTTEQATELQTSSLVKMLLLELAMHHYGKNIL